ncbi:sigma-70 family RNA polymerase sigma factor [soil metagenome]
MNTTMKTRKEMTDAEREADETFDAELLGRIAKGDAVGFEELHERFAGLVYSTVYKVLNDVPDTEDVAQEVFSQIWQKAHLYSRKRGKPLTWIATMARNRAIDRLRSKQRRYRLSDQFRDESKVFEKVTDSDSSDEVYAKETGQIVREAVLELTRDQREAIELAYFGGMTQLEVADTLHQPLGTIKARIRRGMIKLRQAVEPQL